MGRKLCDPTTTSLVIYDEEESEFLIALQKYKTDNRRPFPTWSEVLAIVHSLGYRRVEEREPLPVFTRHNHG